MDSTGTMSVPGGHAVIPSATLPGAKIRSTDTTRAHMRHAQVEPILTWHQSMLDHYRLMRVSILNPLLGEPWTLT